MKDARHSFVRIRGAPRRCAAARRCGGPPPAAFDPRSRRRWLDGTPADPARPPPHLVTFAHVGEDRSGIHEERRPRSVIASRPDHMGQAGLTTLQSWATIASQSK